MDGLRFGFKPGYRRLSPDDRARDDGETTNDEEEESKPERAIFGGGVPRSSAADFNRSNRRQRPSAFSAPGGGNPTSDVDALVVGGGIWPPPNAAAGPKYVRGWARSSQNLPPIDEESPSTAAAAAVADGRGDGDGYPVTVEALNRNSNNSGADAYRDAALERLYGEAYGKTNSENDLDDFTVVDLVAAGIDEDVVAYGFDFSYYLTLAPAEGYRSVDLVPVERTGTGFSYELSD